MTDLDIIKEVQKGDPRRCLDVLYNREFPKVLSYIKKNSGQKEDAQDVFQEALMTFFSYVKLNKFDDKQDIGAFMFVVAMNAWRKKNRKQKMFELTEDHKNVLVEDDFYESFFNKERAVFVKALLSQIGDNCKEILSLSIYEQLSLVEIAQRMDYDNPGTVKTRIYKCKQKLLKLLKGNKKVLEII